MKKVYLDYAAATPMRNEVLEAMRPYYSEHFHNPSATYLSARANRQKLEKARAAVAKDLGARPAEIIFTSGATESNNLAIAGICQKFPGGQILVSAIEHDSVLVPARKAGAKLIPVSVGGLVDLDWLAQNITPKTVLISVGLVNNELGTLQSLKDISRMIADIRQRRASSANHLPLYLHSDAAQGPNYLDVHVARLGVDMMSLNGGKIYGPKQSGALYVKAGTALEPIISGGGQEFGLRAGTENLPAIIGFAKALELVQQKHKEEAARVKKLRTEFIVGIGKIRPEAQINGELKHCAPHILSVTFAGVDNERLMMQLDELGVECAVGSACSASSDEPSHVLKAIGLSDKDARSTLRFSLGAQTSSASIGRAIASLAKSL